MAERAHPEDRGFQDRWFGLKKSRYKQKLYERYGYCNLYIKGKTVLDIPCGTGWGTSLLKGASRITGIDISEEAITYAREHYERSDRRYVTGAMESIPLQENDVEVLICLEGFEHVTQTVGKLFIEEAKRVLIDGGVLIMTCPVLNERGETTGNPYHLCEYDERELVVILNDNFRIQNLERIQGPDGPEYRAVLANRKKDRTE